MRPDLALDPLQRVVDGLGVAAEAPADVLVAVSVEVQGEDARLELRQGGRQARDERAKLLGRDDLVHRIVDGRPGDDLVERRFAVHRARGRLRERHVLVERRVLVARRGLHRRDDLARDAELGEVAEARLAVGPVVADRLVEADEALLDEVVAVAAGEEVRRRLQADEAVVAADEPLVRRRIALLRERDEIAVIDLDLRLSVGGETGHERSFLSSPRRNTAANGVVWVLSGALLPWRQLQTNGYERRSQALLERQVAGFISDLWNAVKRNFAHARSRTAARRPPR